MGLRLGLYGDAGTKTCSGFPGSYGNEQKDADTLAAWGIDYWKFDNCNTDVYTSKRMKSPQYYPIMRDALQHTGKPILFSMCQWGQDNVWEWGASVGNSWRISGDITNNWASVVSIAAQAATLSQYAAPGGFNDLDMMVSVAWLFVSLAFWAKVRTNYTPTQELGNGGLSDAEERAHFGLWAIMKSPIILGTDVTRLKSSTLSIIKNQVTFA
jgi:alpha-galactosidase